MDKNKCKTIAQKISGTFSSISLVSDTRATSSRAGGTQERNEHE
jgi:hypothetical protein